MMPIPLLSCLIFLPVAGAILLILLPKDREEEIRWGALGCALLEVLLAGRLVAGFSADAGSPSFQFAEVAEWIPRSGIRYAVGVDGLSVLLVVLSAFLTPLAMLASWRSVREKQKEFYIALLLVESATIGVFVALDLVLFYVFWELMLIPMALLIGVWGGERRVYASIKFVLYTLVGSLPMLAAVLYCGGAGGTFSIPDLPGKLAEASAAGRMGVHAPMLCFAAFALAFAIKVPVIPLHTWLPDAHVEAPTAGSVILAGVLLKMGAYGFLRVAIPCFPQALTANLGAGITFLDLFRILGVAGIVYGALMAMTQTDLKKLVAYSSVSHLGFVVLGIFSLTVKGVEGAVFQMVSHGLSTGALFLLVGVIYERTHTRSLHDYGGVASVAPRYAFVLVLATLSSIGLPGLNGFPGEFLTLLGAFEVRRWLAAVGGLGVILGAVYMLGMVRRVLFGKASETRPAGIDDLGRRECVIFLPLVASFFVLGLFPRLVVDRLEPAAGRWVKAVHTALRSDAAAPAPAAVPPPGSTGQPGPGSDRRGLRE
jgi:NADH-quinone oxidoreductase subunit M